MIEQFKPFPLNPAVSVGNMGTVIRFNGKQAKITNHNLGYKCVSLSIDGKVKVMKLHRVVALTWVDNPNKLPEVNHIDGVKAHNYASNLEWVTHKDNIIKGHELGVWTKPMGRPSGFTVSQSTRERMSNAKKGKKRLGNGGKWVNRNEVMDRYDRFMANFNS